jgi:hypothetical protein
MRNDTGYTLLTVCIGETRFIVQTFSSFCSDIHALVRTDRYTGHLHQELHAKYTSCGLMQVGGPLIPAESIRSPSVPT